MKILGISAFYHDSAACIIEDGKIVAAAQEERFTRIKHDYSFPSNAIDYCLREIGINSKELDFIAFYDKPFLKFERIIETYLSYAPSGFFSFIKAMPLWVKKKLWIKEIIRTKLSFEKSIIFPEHHESHAASAFFPSPFNEAAFITMDGVGEWATASYGVGEGNKIKIIADIQFPHSLGLLYSAFTYFCGFKVNSGEYKLMGLAPYGEPIYRDLIMDSLIDIKADGSFRMDMDYFNYPSGLKMTNRKFEKLFGGVPRKMEAAITKREMDIARSIQEVTNEIVLKIGNNVYKETGKKKVCLAGGVALNCVANGKLLRDGPFDEVWIQPASGDAGGAIGAAFFVWHQYLNNEIRKNEKDDLMQGAYLGPSYNNDEIKEYITSNNIPYTYLAEDKLLDKVADLIANEKVIGWFQGRMEFGPRALGARSIIGDARSKNMQKTMNEKIKFRESFRPFAPSVLEEDVSDYFELEKTSPYMMLVANVKVANRIANVSEAANEGFDRIRTIDSEIPAVTHVDYTARVQTVSKNTNKLYYELIRRFRDKYKCSVIINTSFNVRGEPIVCTPSDAYKCFMRTKIDYLVMGNFLLDKKNQEKIEMDINWKKEYSLD